MKKNLDTHLPLHHPTITISLRLGHPSSTILILDWLRSDTHYFSLDALTRAGRGASGDPELLRETKGRIATSE